MKSWLRRLNDVQPGKIGEQGGERQKLIYSSKSGVPMLSLKRCLCLHGLLHCTDDQLMA